jgi:hypothetical protein
LGIAVTAAAIAFFRRRERPPVAGKSRRPPGFAIGIAAWVALLIYMMKIGAEATGRLVAAYYPLLLLPILLHPLQEGLVRQRWWKVLALLAGAGALADVVLTPSRPLWPAEEVCAWTAKQFPRSKEVARAGEVYSVYRDRGDLMAPVRRHIPSAVQTIGFLGGDWGAESSLWLPFGSRRVVDLFGTGGIDPSTLEWVVIKRGWLEAAAGDSLEHWVGRRGGSIVAEETITSWVTVGPEQWTVVHFPASANRPAPIQKDYH